MIADSTPPRLAPTKQVHDRARELFVAHMRKHGRCGDGFENLSGFIKALWFERAEDELCRKP